MPLSEKEYNWLRNERAIVILAIENLKFLVIIGVILLWTWVFWMSIQAQVRTRRIVREEIRAAVMDARVVPKEALE